MNQKLKMSTDQTKKLTNIEGYGSVVLNTVLFALKIWAGIITGSIALVADAWHTLTDSFSSVIIIIGAWFSRQPPDKEHPFGHGRAELITSSIIGMLLAVIAFDFLKEGIVKFKAHEATNYGTIAIVATIVSIVVKELMAQYAFWAGRKTGSRMLKADAWHHRSDAISSVVILIGIFFGRQWWWIDAVLGMIVALLIGYASFEIMRDTIHAMLGEAPDEAFLKKLNALASNLHNKDLKIHHVHLHSYGRHKELTLHIKLEHSTTLLQAHEIATRLESSILKEMDIEATIHMEPVNASDFHD